MLKLLPNLWCEDDGQDLIEYTLLLAFLVLATASFFGMSHDSIAGITSKSNSQITAAGQFAGS